MSWERWAEGIVVAWGIYAGIGILFAGLFVTRGVERVDAAAHGASWGFRILILPGVAALWPLLASRWLRGAPPPDERTAHRRAAGSPR